MSLGIMLGGCRQGDQVTLSAALLDNAVPPQLLTEFEKTLQSGIQLQVESKAQLSDLFTQLQTWHAAETSADDRTKKPALPTNVMALGDYWLQPAIQQGLIQPMNPASWAGWNDLGSLWQQLVRRDRQGKLSASGDLWAAPYRWGHLMIAYSKSEFENLGWQPQDWVDLWRPELQRRFSLPDSARTVIGLTLKMLGHGFNEAAPLAIADLQPTLSTLNQQVKVYSSDAYLQPLIIGDTWLAVGWSTDILPVLERNKSLAGVIPSSGTLLSADVWVVPTNPGATASSSNTSTQQWVEFYWQRAIAEQLSLLSSGASPLLLKGDRANLPEALQENQLLIPPADIMNQSEFLEPVSEEAIAQYKDLWVKTRVADPLNQ